MSFDPDSVAESIVAQSMLSGPTYISSHSADVILSDIRPIKLKIEALRCINVLLDEFLYSILAAARSLSTDKLRAGLLKVLPTNLGKEALLEAEVELRAYWERTKLPGGPSSPMLEEGQGFNLQWSFEVRHPVLLVPATRGVEGYTAASTPEV